MKNSSRAQTLIDNQLGTPVLPLRLPGAVHRAIIEHSSDAHATVINEWYSNQSDATDDGEGGFELRQDYRYGKLVVALLK